MIRTSIYIRESSNKLKAFLTFSSKESEIQQYNQVESMVNDEARLPDEGDLQSYWILSMYYYSISIWIAYYWRLLTFLDANCPKKLIVRSEGLAKNWRTKLGKYKLHEYDSAGNAVYTHSPNNGYLLYRVKGSEPIWMVNSIVFQN